MKLPKRQFILFSTEVNRSLFEGEIDKALHLIGDYMQKNGFTASIDVLASIPIEHDRAAPNPLAP